MEATKLVNTSGIKENGEKSELDGIILSFFRQ